jgi:hypothetical protein
VVLTHHASIPDSLAFYGEEREYKERESEEAPCFFTRSTAHAAGDKQCLGQLKLHTDSTGDSLIEVHQALC